MLCVRPVSHVYGRAQRENSPVVQYCHKDGGVQGDHERYNTQTDHDEPLLPAWLPYTADVRVGTRGSLPGLLTWIRGSRLGVKQQQRPGRCGRADGSGGCLLRTSVIP